ncbi:MAG: hypothetical protein OXG78_11875 [Chloroflexi bacterium]|nr:hypothetical protein [Chloroflexota bacterium]
METSDNLPNMSHGMGNGGLVAGLSRRLTAERAAIVIVFLLIFAMASRVTADPDMWWHIRLGQQSIETGDFVYADTFSHTQRGNIHKNHSWLAQIVMAGVWDLGGHFVLTLVVASLAAGGMACLYLAGRGSIYMQGFVLVAGGACAAVFWSPRPQMFTFFFAALLVNLLRQLKRDSQAPLWILPAMMWLWANLHAGYIVGYLFIGAFVSGELLNRALVSGRSAVAWPRIRRLCAFTLLSLALLPISPLGLDVFLVPFETFAISGMREFIAEWNSPDFAQPATWPFVVLLIALIASSWASRRKIDFADLLLVGGTMFMALYSARHLPLFVIAAAPVLTAQLNDGFERNGWRIPRRAEETGLRLALNILLVFIVAIGTAARVAYVSRPDTVAQSLALNYPVGAVEFLRTAEMEGNLFNSYNWGGYLIFALPEHPVFIDGRTDLYHDALDEYTAAAFGTPAWSEVFTRREIGIALIETDGPLAQRLDADENWSSVYRDGVASVYAHVGATAGGNSL